MAGWDHCIGELRLHGRDWSWWKERLAKRVGARFFGYGPAGSSIWQEDWDSLIVLDDCRYDLFLEMYGEEHGEPVRPWTSLGNNTSTWLERNFTSERYDDLVYVSANPYADRALGGRCAGVVPVWDSGWDEEAGTVLPEEVYQAALEAVLRLDGEKLVVHFLQPHCPYPGYDLRLGFRQAMLEIAAGSRGEEWVRPRRGERPLLPLYCWRRPANPAYLDGYVKNLRWVLPLARRLADFLPGRTVITADHGEALGEKFSPLLPLRVYGHDPAIRLQCTATVPWVVIEPLDKRPGDLEDELRQAAGRNRERRAGRERERVKRRVAGLRGQGRI